MKDLYQSVQLKPYFKYSFEIIRSNAKSFFFASKFLPKDVRFATYAIYAYCRFVDDTADNPRERSNSEVLSELDYIRDEIEIAYRSGESEHPALRAFVAVARRYGIPKKLPLDLIEGARMDLTKSRYENFDELYEFAYKVASVVGLMMTYALGFKRPETLDYAEKLGISMQLTNILRDVKEDKEMGRIYLPSDEMREFGVSEEQIIDERFDGEFKNFMIYQVERACSYYQAAEPGIDLLNKKSRFSIRAASRIYGGILKKLEEVDYNPFKGRVFVPKSEKINILIKEILKNKFSDGK